MSRPAVGRSTSTPWIWRGFAAALVAVTATLVFADPFPPYWDGGSGAAVHFAPVAWPAANGWTPYTKLSADINDRAISDESNGGTSPQSYVNVSSGCTDQTEPSVYYAYDPGAHVLFFRWRVGAPPHTFATGPNPGTFGATSPWSSALWTVFIDINGDGYRDFALHLDGSSGGPSAAVDRLSAIWSPTRSQSLDYVNDPQIHLIAHNPTAFVDGPSGSNRLLNFHGTLTPDANWPNGAAESEWDYGTTRATKLNTGCGEYFIDYQMPLAMLDATAFGGPAVTPTTPMSLFFATANSLNNPLQKDVVVSGDFLADPSRPVPGGDTITLGGGVVAQPIVQSLTAIGCGPTTLTATVLDTLDDAGASTLSGVNFLVYADVDGDGVANDGSDWNLAGAGAPTSTVGQWRTTWNGSAQPRGRYLFGVQATDQQGNVTYSFLDQTDVTSTYGPGPYFANPTGLVAAGFDNTCGTAGASIAIAVSPATVGAGQPVTMTVTLTNPQAQPLAVTSIADLLPPGFTYQSTTGGTLVPLTNPTGGASGSIQWTFASTSVPASGSGTLIFTALASATAGTYSTTASGSVAVGTVTSAPADIAVGSASLRIAKTASVSAASPGDPITYTIAYTNDSAANATSAVITDVLPEGLDFVSASDGGSYDTNTRTVTWSVGTVAAGAGPFAVSLATTVTSPYPAGASSPVVNTASIASTETSSTGSSSAVYVNAPRPRLAIQISAPSNLVAYNTQVVYTISAANIGEASAADTTLTLPIPTGWSFASATGGGANVSGTVTWSLGSLAANTTVSRQVTLQTGPAVYTGANPVTKTATLAATGVTPAADAFTIGLTGLGDVCRTFYFRDTTANVGVAGTQRIANTTPTVLSDSGATATNTSTGSANEVELVSFFRDPATTSQVDFNGQITSNMWVLRPGGPTAVVTGYVYDHDPATGTETLLGSGQGNFSGNSITLFSFDVPVNGTLATGHRLRWRYTLRSNNVNTGVTLSVLYGGGVSGTLRDSNSYFCVTAPATPVLDVQVDKLLASAGEVLTYTIPFANAGANSMTSSQIAVTLPDGVSFTSATMNGSPVSPAGAGQVRTFTVDTAGVAGTVAANGTGVLVVTATISAPFAGSGLSLTTSASYSSTQTSPVVDGVLTRLLAPSITIVKSVDDALLGAGDTVTYSLDVLNGGPGAASGVSVTDVLPITGYYSYVAQSARLNGVVINPDPVSGGTLTALVGALAPGASARVTFQMQVAASGVPSGYTAVSNTASASDASTSGSATSNTTSITISTSPNLLLTKTSNPASGPLEPGDTIVYTLVIGNTGSSDAVGVHLVDPIPTDTSYESGSLAFNGTPLTDAVDGDAGAFDPSSNRVTLDVGTLAAGASRTYTYSVSLPPTMPAGSTTLGSTATATAGNAASRTATSSIGADAAPVLSLAKSGPARVAFPLTTLSASATGATVVSVATTSGLAIGDVVTIGGVDATILGVNGSDVTLSTAVTAASGAPVVPTFEYVISYTNAGNAPTAAAEVTDSLPSGLDFVSASAPGIHTAGTVSWSLPAIAPGESGAVRLRVRPTAAGAYANLATLSASGLSPVSSNPVSTRVGSLIVTKSTTTPNTTPGDGTYQVATYVITVENQDPTTTATGVTISDQLPAGFSFESTDGLSGAAAATSPAFGDTRPTWTGLDIAPASTATLTFTARLGNVAPGTFQNEVFASGGTVPVVGFDPLATTAEDVTVAAVLGTTGIPTVTPSIVPGGTLTLTVSDLDLDTDGAVVETVVVRVTNPRTSEQEDVTLTETGPSTGVFTGTLTSADSPLGGTDFSGPINVQGGDSISVIYEDAFTGMGTPGSAGASATVTSVGNNAPTANDDTATVAEDAGDTVVAVLDNDSTAPDTGETLTISSATQGTNGGVVTITGGGTGLTYRPVANATAGETFTYTIDDGHGGTDTATVTVTITAGNDDPTATDDTAVVNRGVVNVLYVLGNDTDAPDTGETLTVVGVTQGVTGGAVTISDGGNTVTYEAPEAGATDSFTYTIADGNGGTDTATVVVSMNNAPIAFPDTATVAQDGGVTHINVLANDTFLPDSGEFLFIYDVSPGSHGGTVNITGCGTIIQYTPPAGFSGTETFIYTIRDNHGGEASALVTVTVTDPNDPPTAVDDAATVAEDAATAAIAVLANDSIAPDTGETLTISAVTQGSQGGVVVVTGGGAGLTYRPAADVAGTETFTYTVADGRGGSDTATVTVTVTSVNDLPTAAADSATVGRNTSPAAIDVLGNDSTAPDTGETLAIGAVTQGTQGGTVTITGGGTGLTYAPAPGFSGTETFTYTIDDGRGGTATATVTVTVGDGAYRRYFSEGLNNANTATHISLANPAQVARPIHMEFYRQTGPSILYDLTLGPRARTTIDTRTIPGLADAPFATAIEAEATVVAERTMSWDYGEPGMSLEHAVEAAQDWYFAEGATTGPFTLFYLLMNPGTVPATATIDFLPQVGPPVQRSYVIAPHTRLTIPVDTVAETLASADLGAAVHADRPIVVERSMYLSTPTTTWIAGTTGAGVTAPLTRWYFGEGSVGPFFDAWILLANPSPTPATAEVRYLSEDGRVTVTTHTVPVGRRITIRVADDAPALFASSFGVVVTSTNAVPIVAERAMWWPNDGSGWYEGHVAAGLPGTARAWGVADGIAAPDGSSETYVLIANTSTRAGVVKVTTVFDDGTPAIEHDVAIGGEVRMTLRMRTFQPEVVGKRFSVFVEAQGPSPIDLVVEHSSYSNTTVVWGAGSSAPASPIQ
jgi:uncharacterized repeat protein (TIGR01451 family)